MGATQLKKYFSYLRKSARSRCWSLGWSRRLGQRRDTLTRPAGLYLGVSECGSGVEPCQGGSQRYSLPSIVIKSYVLICQVSPASICHERGEQRGLCDHHLDPRTRTIHQKLVRKPSRDRKHLSEMHSPCIMCVCLRCNISSQ